MEARIYYIMLCARAATGVPSTSSATALKIEAADSGDRLESRVQHYMGRWAHRHATLRLSDFATEADMDTPFVYTADMDTRASSAPEGDGSACRHLPDSDERYRFLRDTCSQYEADLAAILREAGPARARTATGHNEESRARGPGARPQHATALLVTNTASLRLSSSVTCDTTR